MNIGIVVHSVTGNTLSVATQLKTQLEAQDHEVTLLHLKLPADFKPSGPTSVRIEILDPPSLNEYDALAIGAPVEAFSLSAVMKQFLGESDPLRGQPVVTFMTQYFPFAWMGGNRAANQMMAVIGKQGGRVVGGGVINRSRKNSQKQTDELVVRLTRALEQNPH